MRCSNLEKFKEPLCHISYDSANTKTVCNYENEFINFDKAKGALRKKYIGKTPDILYVDDTKREIWFIEIKSSSKENLDSLERKIGLKRKLFAGLILLYELCCMNSCLYKEYKKFYFVVFDKKYENFEDEVIDSFAVDSPRSIEFGLEDLKPQFVDEVFTEDCSSFVQLFRKRFGIEFMRKETI